LRSTADQTATTAVARSRRRVLNWNRRAIQSF
jgi:hypothetical protein